MNSKYKSKFKRILLITMIVIMCLGSSAVVFADGSEPIKLGPTDEHENIWIDENKGSNDPSEKRDMELGSLPASSLYGSIVYLMRYNGEVAPSDGSPYYYSTKTDICGTSRDVSATENDLDDLHIIALTSQFKSFTISIYNIALSFSRGLPYVIIKIYCRLKNLNLNDVLDLFTGSSAGQSISSAIRATFLIDDAGNLSPFLAIFLILYLGSLVVLIFKRLRSGDSSFMSILKEIGIFILSVVIFAIGINDTTITTISKAGIEIATALQPNSNGDTNDAQLFQANISDTYKNAYYNDIGLYAKASIDNQLCGYFGVDDISDLSVGDSRLKVTNGIGSVNNLGYAYWAGNQNYTNPYTGSKTTYSNNQIYYFIPDYLQDNGGKGNASYFSMFNKINNPGIGGLVISDILFLLMAGTLCWAAFFAVLVICQGKLMLIAGPFLIPIMPGLILFPKTRKFAKDMASTYFVGFLRNIIGGVMFTMLIIMFSTFSKNGEFGCIIGAVIFALVALAMPSKILPAINRILAPMEMRQIQELRSGISRKFNSIKFNPNHSRLGPTTSPSQTLTQQTQPGASNTQTTSNSTSTANATTNNGNAVPTNSSQSTDAVEQGRRQKDINASVQDPNIQPEDNIDINKINEDIKNVSEESINRDKSIVQGIYTLFTMRTEQQQNTQQPDGNSIGMDNQMVQGLPNKEDKKEYEFNSHALDNDGEKLSDSAEDNNNKSTENNIQSDNTSRQDNDIFKDYKKVDEFSKSTESNQTTEDIDGFDASNISINIGHGKNMSKPNNSIDEGNSTTKHQTIKFSNEFTEQNDDMDIIDVEAKDITSEDDY